MLVRNNTKCSSCGRFSPMDLYVTGRPLLDSGALRFRVECSDCGASAEGVFDHATVHGWIRLLASTSGLTGRLANPRRWSAITDSSNQEIVRSLVRDYLDDFFERGVFVSEFAGSSVMYDLCQHLKTPGVPLRTLEHLRNLFARCRP